MLRPLTRHRGILVLAGIFVLPVASVAARAEVCRTDPATGLSIPARAAGVCVGAFDGETVLVQRNRQGIFVAGLEGGTAIPADEGLEAHGPSSRVVYCPAGLLDFASGAPSPDCLAAGPGIRPGRGALVGSGYVQASVRSGDGGAASCRTSSRVVASLVSSEGERFDVTGSLRMTASPEQGTCGGAYDRVELAYRAEAESTARGEEAEATSPERARRLERLMQLDEDQWQAVELMLSLTPGDWELLQALVAEDAPAATPATAAPPGGNAIDLGAAAGAAPNPEAQVLSVAQMLNTIVARLNAVRSNIDGLVGRIPDRPDVRALVGQIDLGQLRGVMDQVRDTLQGLVEVARELRAGYDTFDAAQFRQRLGGVLDDLERATLLYQQLLCLDNPDITPRALPTALLRRLLDRVPPVILYGLSRALDAMRDDWDTALGTIVDAVPAELTQFCNNGVATRDLAFEVESAICVALRPGGTKKALVGAQAYVGVFLLVMNFVKNRTDEQIAVTAGANVVAGATVGTVVKNPAYEAVEGIVDKTEKVKDVLEKLVDRRKDCLEADADIENDLRECAKDGCLCTVPLTFVLDGATAPSYTYAARLVETRIDQSEAAGVGDPATARTFFAVAEDDANVGTPAGYTALCQAYGALLEATTVSPPGEEPGALKPSAPLRRKVSRP